MIIIYDQNIHIRLFVDKLFIVEYNGSMEVNTISRLRDIRLGKGWTQFQLSQESGVPQPTISQIERGNRKNPSHLNVLKLSKALNIRAEEFFVQDENNLKS